jgi:NAD(P)-dependent dehydrogenase (short-subunit alcohol dehydrogenase family)/DNA-binding response OmpR family regulator
MIDAPAAPSVLLLRLSREASQARQTLEEEGLWLTACDDVAEALRRARSQHPDLVVVHLDGRRPEEWQALQRVVDAAGRPTLALVDDGSVETRLAALASGADDVLVQPAHPMELAVRARALLRRGGAPEARPTTLRHAELELDVEGFQASLAGQPLQLSPLEFRLLRALMESPQRTFSRDELVARTHTFDDELPDDRSVDLHVSELRHKLGDSARSPRYVETVRGVGYRLARGEQRLPLPERNGRHELCGRTALVTGGGRGIGRAIAHALAEAGAMVVVTARTASEIEAVALELRQRGHQAEAMTCDVTQPDQVQAVVESVNEQWGGADILVCNAGLEASVPTHKMDDALWERLLAVNLSGPFYAARAALPHMLERRWGRIIMIASTAARAGYLYSAGYCAAKHGLLGFTRALALETAQKGITVNAVCPSFVDTDMAHRAAQNIADKTGRSVDDALGTLARMTPQNRLIQPEEVARMVVILAGEGSRGITGQGINVDGGAVMS